jgi:hypothetical protein
MFVVLNETITIYKPAQEITILACVEQHQICKPYTSGFPRCSPYLSTIGIMDFIPFMPSNAIQRDTAYQVLNVQSVSDLSWVASRIPGQPLLASQTLDVNTQYRTIPKDQWRTRSDDGSLQRWHSFSTAWSKSQPVPPIPRSKRDTKQQEICGRQRLRKSTTNQNFNMAAIVVVLSLGFGIILLGLKIDSCVGWLQTRYGRGGFRRTQWILDGLFQQQRLAYEGPGVEGWT